MFFSRPFLILIFIFSLLALKVSCFLYIALIAMLLSTIFIVISVILLRRFGLINLLKTPDLSIKSFFYFLVNFALLYCMVNIGQVIIPLIFFLLQCFYIFFIPRTKIGESIAQGRKMSEIILEFAQPWLDQCETFKEEKDILALSVLAWNLSLSKHHVSKKMIVLQVKKSGIAKKNAKSIICKLIEKRRKTYTKYTFKIFNSRYIERDNGAANLTVLGYIETDEAT